MIEINHSHDDDFATAEVDQRRPFTDVFYELSPKVRALATRRVGRQLADDVVQETFLRAFKAYDRYVDRGTTWAWVRTIAERVCIDIQRRSRFDAGPVDTTADAMDEVGTSPDTTLTTVMAHHERTAVSSVLASLNPRHRRVLVLREMAGWSTSEIAVGNDMTVEGVKATLKRARVAFRAAYTAHAERTTSGLGAVVAVGTIIRRELRRLATIGGRVAPAQGALAGVAAVVVAVSIVVGTSPLKAFGAEPPSETTAALAASTHDGSVVDDPAYAVSEHLSGDAHAIAAAATTASNGAASTGRDEGVPAAEEQLAAAATSDGPGVETEGSGAAGGSETSDDTFHDPAPPGGEAPVSYLDRKLDHIGDKVIVPEQRGNACYGAGSGRYYCPPAIIDRDELAVAIDAPTELVTDEAAPAEPTVDETAEPLDVTPSETVETAEDTAEFGVLVTRMVVSADRQWLA